MAEFCKQCSINVFGKDYGDFKGMTTEEDTENGLFMPVLCEGCISGFVDHTGKCVSKICLHKHGMTDDFI